MLGYGGNTSCLLVELSDRAPLVLDAGTGIRSVGERLAGARRPVHVLLSHLHLDHTAGLLFFAPLFDPAAQVTIWGPPAHTEGLRPRLARYLSAPLSPIELRDLPATVAYRTVPAGRWRLEPATVTAALVNHRGVTLGYRIEDAGAALAYLPDLEPGLGQRLDRDPLEWISGAPLARGATLLVHDAQYTNEEYAGTVGWGHATVDQALTFAAGAERLALFHHDPTRDDDALDAISARASAAASCPVLVSREGETLDLGPRAP